MERSLASLQKISKLEAIPQADFIEVACVKGWKVVVRKGFKVNDLCVYIEIDSLLPDREEFAAFKGKGRIKTKKLKGVISQGVCFTLEEIKEDLSPYKEGDDLTDLLGVKLYESPIDYKIAGDTKGLFPYFINKTGSHRVQNVDPSFLKEQFILTEKLDGSSATFYLYNGEYGVCSHNYELKDTPGNVFWEISRKYSIQEKLKQYGRNIALQGEIVGPNLPSPKKNPYLLKNPDLFFFRGMDLDTRLYLNPSDFLILVADMGWQHVPLLGKKEFSSLEEMLIEADGYSAIQSSVRREGLVVSDESYNNHYKIVSNLYLLGEK